MATNAEKTEICNMAISILREGKTAVAGQFYSDINDTVFADPTTATNSGIERMTFAYPQVLQEVLRDIKPDRAKHFADLGAKILIDKEIADWDMLFELPDDYLDMIAQIAQGDHKKHYDYKIFTFDSYAHVVKGTDDWAYKCKADVTASTATRPITGTWTTNWEIYDANGNLGADWVSGWTYKASKDGLLLATNIYSNDPSVTVDGSVKSAYISYIPYVLAGVNDKPAYYTPEFKRAFAVRLASALTKDVEKQNGLLARYTRHDRKLVRRIENMDDYKKPHVTTLAARTRGIRLSR